MGEEQKTHFAEGFQKKSEKSANAKAENNKQSKDNNTKIYCCVAGAFGCLVVIIGLFFLVPFIGALISSQGNVVVPLPSSAPTSGPTGAPTYQPTKAALEYPVPQSCPGSGAIPSEALNISTRNPGLKQDFDNHYYAVYGYTTYDIAQQIHQCGIVDNEETYAAMTYYNINWFYQFRSVGSSCGIENVTVGLKVDIYYPDWQKPETFEPGLDQKWQDYASAVTLHENIHRDNDIQAAQEVYNSLSSLGIYASCDEAATTANNLGYEILANYDNINKTYDDSTNHGETQGAAWR